MDSSGQPDRLSSLPDCLLILIISCLHFKDCVKTSILSKRWRFLYRETRNVAFRESDFVNTSVYGEQRVDARMAFVEYVCRWVARIHDQPIDSFEICISYPSAYLDEIRDLIEFACRKRVKNLVLDFSDPSWRTLNDLERHAHRAFVVEVPESVFLLKTLESLKVCACKMFDPSRFWNPEKFKSLSFGWMRLPNLELLLSETTRLESLSINDCWGIDASKIAGDMRELAFKNCHFLFFGCTFDLPRVDVFKYTGSTCYLKFQRMNTVIKEVHLDFGVLGESDELNESTNEEAGVLCDILNDLRSARTLIVSPYLLQVIQRFEDTTHLLRPVETQHLVLKTTLHPKDFNGIRLLLDKCPDLETFTFDLLPRKSIVTTSSYAGIDPRTYWMQNITYNCLRKTLKAVVVKNFVGGLNELNVLRYLIRSGGEHEPVLERIELYVPYGFEYSQKMFAYAGAEMLQRSSEHVQVSCAQFLKRWCGSQYCPTIFTPTLNGYASSPSSEDMRETLSLERSSIQTCS